MSSFAKKVSAVTAISFGTAVLALDATILTVAVPAIARDMGVNPARAILILTVYQLVVLACLLPFSSLAARTGYTNLYRAGLLIYSVASVVGFFAQDLYVLLGVRVLQAVGAAASMSVSAYLVRSIYPVRHLGKGLSFNSVVVQVSSALAPALGGWLMASLSWRWLFVVAVPLALLSLLFSRFLPRAEPVASASDVVGIVLYMVIALSVFFLLQLAAREGVLWGVVFLLGWTLAMLFLLLRHQQGIANPALPLSLCRQPLIAVSLLAAVLSFTASMMVISSLPFRLEQEFGFSPATIGSVLSAWPFAAMITAPVAGYLSDKVSAAIMGSLGLVIGGAALLVLSFAGAGTAIEVLIGCMAFSGMGFALFLQPNMRLIVGSVADHQVAAAGGMVSTGRLLGQMIGVSIVAIFLAHSSRGVQTMSVVAAVLVLIAAVLSYSRYRIQATGSRE